MDIEPQLPSGQQGKRTSIARGRLSRRSDILHERPDSIGICVFLPGQETASFFLNARRTAKQM